MKKWWKELMCKWFHRKDHVCWDSFFEKEYPAHWWTPPGVPGSYVWFCNRCQKSWTTVNPRVFATDCANDEGWLPKKYYRQPGREIIIQKCKCNRKEKNEKGG